VSVTSAVKFGTTETIATAPPLKFEMLPPWNSAKMFRKSSVGWMKDPFATVIQVESRKYSSKKRKAILTQKCNLDVPQ
jgi:hypothetical protein